MAMRLAPRESSIIRTGSARCWNDHNVKSPDFEHNAVSINTHATLLVHEFVEPFVRTLCQSPASMFGEFFTEAKHVRQTTEFRGHIVAERDALATLQCGITSSSLRHVAHDSPLAAFVHPGSIRSW
jgi:hypothetical protein